MKKRYVILNLSLMITVLFSILFQSLHSYEHIVKEFSEVKCEHSHDTGATQITHQHPNFDHCFTCEFAFGNFIAPELFSYELRIIHPEIPYFFASTEAAFAFSGSTYSLRGPPVVNC